MHIVNPSHPLNAGRLAWWLTRPDLGGGGRTFRDLIGSNHGTITNVTAGPTSGWRPTTRPGGRGELALDGTDDYVATTFTRLGGRAGCSFAAWVRTTSGVRTGLAGSSGASSGRLSIDLNRSVSNPDPGKVYAVLWDGSGNKLEAYTTAATGVNNGGWHRVLTTFDCRAATQAIYIDGRAVATTSVFATVGPTTPDLAQPLLLGAFYFAGPQLFLPGALDDVSVWGRSLSASEAWADFDDGQRGYPGTLTRPARRSIVLFGVPPAPAAPAPGGIGDDGPFAGWFGS